MRFGKQERNDCSLILMCSWIELTRNQMCWSISVNLTQNKVTWEQGTPVEELLTSNLPMGMSVGHFLDC